MQPASEVHPADESVEVAMPRDAKCVADSPDPDADTGTTGRAASPPATAEEQRQHREVMVAIAVLTVCGMAYQTANGACLPLYAKYAERLGLGESAGGLVIAAPSVARVILNLRLGKLADDLGRKELLVGGSLIMAIGAYCTAAASSLWMMLLARLLMGAGGAASDIAAQACRLDVVARFPARRGMLLGAAQSLTMLAYAAGPVVGGRLALHGGVHVPFNVLGVVLCVCAPLYGFLPKTQAATARLVSIKPVATVETKGNQGALDHLQGHPEIDETSQQHVPSETGRTINVQFHRHQSSVIASVAAQG